jgi:Spy/CpxP family protein refolding chaperone
MSTATTGMTGKALVLIGAIFLLGMVAGASLFYVGQRSVASANPPPAQQGPPERGPRQERGQPPPGPLEDMTRRFGLTDDQQTRIREILARYRGEMDGMLEASRLEIREVLTDEQREQFDTMRPPRPGGHRPPPGQRPPPRRGRRKPPPPPRD